MEASLRIDDLGSAELVNACYALHTACLRGDLDSIQSILRTHPPSSGIPLAALQDPDGFTALHSAAESGSKECVEWLLSHEGGAVWAMPDDTGNTAGDVAFSFQHEEAYKVIHDHAVRSILLQNALSSDDEEETDDEAVDEGEEKPSLASNPKAFLASELRFLTSPKTGRRVCVDSDNNGVMMGWETPIMDRTAEALCLAAAEGGEGQGRGLAVLNVGFGLGIVDDAFQRHKPRRHVIIEPHPSVLRYLYSTWLPSLDPSSATSIPDSLSLKELAAHPEVERLLAARNIEVFPGRWQDFLASILDSDFPLSNGFDVIYWDTFSESYPALCSFIASVPQLLRDLPSSRWSFFHGLGADSRLLYDVYTTLVEAEIRERGMVVEWEEIRVPMLGEVEWEGVAKRYWNIPAPYRLAICQEKR